MPKIEDYALLSDLHMKVVVSTGGSIDWLCLPRFDSPAAFTALLGNDEKGHWTLAPAGRAARAPPAGTQATPSCSRPTGSPRTARCGSSTSCCPDTPHVVRIAGAWTARWRCDRRCGCGSTMAGSSAGPAPGCEVHAIAGPNLVRLAAAVPGLGGRAPGPRSAGLHRGSGRPGSVGHVVVLSRTSRRWSMRTPNRWLAHAQPALPRRRHSGHPCRLPGRGETRPSTGRSSP